METEAMTIPTTAEPISDPAMDEHRAALYKMRCDYALEQLYAASGAHDPAVLRRLIDIGEGDITVGEDGVPDVSAVRDKIEVMRREQSYLFRDVPVNSAPANAESASAGLTSGENRTSTGVRLGVLQKTDYAQMDDASYYRAVMGKRGRRR